MRRMSRPLPLAMNNPRSTGCLLAVPLRFFAWLIGDLRNTIEATREFFSEEVEDAPLADALEKAVAHPDEILRELNALRKHLVRGALALVLTTALSFTYFEQILAWLARPLPGGMAALQAIEVTEPIGTVMRVSLFTGFALAFPYIALELWLFVGPGLSRASRLWGLFAIPVATLFFIGGMAFAYYVMMPTALPFLLTFMGINTIPRPSNYVSFVTGLMFWIGIAFEFPLVIFLLARLGLVNARMLAVQWRIAVVIMAVIAAIITPTVDPVNMSLVMLPMLGLYLLSILLALFARPRRSKAPAHPPKISRSAP